MYFTCIWICPVKSVDSFLTPIEDGSVDGDPGKFGSHTCSIIRAPPRGGFDGIQHNVGGACGSSVMCAVREPLDSSARPISRRRQKYEREIRRRSRDARLWRAWNGLGGACGTSAMFDVLFSELDWRRAASSGPLSIKHARSDDAGPPRGVWT